MTKIIILLNHVCAIDLNVATNFGGCANWRLGGRIASWARESRDATFGRDVLCIILTNVW